MDDTELDYDRCEKIAEETANFIIETYFECVRRDKLSPKEMLFKCSQFIHNSWPFLIEIAMEIEKRPEETNVH